jgi:hypothetical protein
VTDASKQRRRERMADAADPRCDAHADPFNCADALVRHSPRFDEYGIIIHDGGSAPSLIAYCPRCGARLPESERAGG